MSEARRPRLLRDILLTTTALVAALAGGGKAALGGSAPSSGLSGFKVVAGGATLSTPSASKSVITQSTNKAIITWSAFGIPKGSTVQFVQPGSSSVALNRVTSNNVTNIMGSLLANGQVWIVNPAGVFFGPGAQVDVAGLMATTADIKNGDFLSGNYQFGIGSSNPNASIVNQGTIRTTNGSTVLVGAQVTNQGLIAAQMGSVVLGGAKTFAVDFQGDKLLSFQVTGPVDQRPQNPDGTPANALVSNSGTITASGGTVLLTARAAKNVIDNVINSSGIIEAVSAKSVNGEIILDGGDTGAVSLSGTLDASGKGAGETGGTVKVLGDQVSLAAGATIDVSGDAGGGTALVGGNFHGTGPEANASTTTVSAGSTINASAITKGNGGKVAVWSNTLTTFGGTITATGGSTGGSGGYVETSGKQLGVFNTAKVDTSAAKGTAGTWLLDPTNVTIVSGTGITETQDDIFVSTLSGTKTFNAPGDSDSDDASLSIGAGLISQALSLGTNVVVSAANNLVVAANITDSGASAVSLTLIAGGTSTSSTGTGVLTVGNGVSILSTNGPLSVNLFTGTGSGSSIVLGAGSVFDTKGGNLLFGSKVLLGTASASSGTVTLRTTGAGSPGAVAFNSSIDDFGGASVGLSLNAGAVQFSGSIGAGTPIASLGVTATSSTLRGTAVHTKGDDSFSGPVTLASNETVTSDTGNITFGGAIDGGVAMSLIAASGTVSLGNVGASTPLTSLLVDPVGIVLTGNSYDTSGGQTYSLGVTLGANVTLVSTTGSINFLGAIDGPFALSATASSGTVSAGGVIGGQTALSSFSASGKTVGLSGIGSSASDGVTGTVSIAGSSLITLNGSAYHSGGSESFSGPVTLLHDETITSDNGDVRFIGTTSTIDGGFALTLNAASASGTVTLGGSVGAITELTSLLVDPATIALGGSTYHTSQGQTYSVGVTLGTDATLISDHGSVTFLGSIDGGHTLGISAVSGAASLGGAVGASSELTSLAVAAGSISLGGTGGSVVHTTGSESFSGPVTLQHDETIASDNGSINFNGTVSTINGGFALALTAASSTGTVSLGGSVGAFTPLTSLLVDPATIALGGLTYHTSQGQTYSVGVSLGTDVTVISDHGSVTFLDSVDGGHSLGVSAGSGAASFGGAVGAGTELTSLTVSAGSISLGGSGGSVVHTSGGESFSGPVTLQHDETVTSDTSTITFGSKVDGAFGLTATAAVLTTFEGAVGGTTPLASLTVTHAVDLNGGTVTTTGAQSYDGPVTLSANALLTANSILFEGKIDGAFSLAATATGLTTFEGAVGSSTPLTSLVVTNAADLNGGSVTTSGAQNYDGAVTLTADALLKGTAITFQSTVDGAHALTATATGLTTFDGAVGGTTPLSSLTVANAADLNGGSVTTSGAQNYDGAVTLTSNALLTGSAITFLGTVDGAHALTATATGLTTFDGAVGGTTPLTSLVVTNAADLNGGSVTTSGAQNYDGAVTLTADALLKGTAITFARTVDGAHALTATATGLTTFDGAVGGTTPLSNLTVTNAADLNGGTITTTGAQNYDGLVTLTSNAVLTGTAITFLGTVDGAHGLTATATGLTTFDGAVGGTTPLSSLTVANAADLNGGSVTTSGAQNYDGAVTLTSNALLTGSVITFLGTVDGAHGLTATATGLTTFEGAVGSGTPLTSLLVTNAADLNGGSIETTGTQSYGGPVTLTADATLTSISGDVTFTSTVDGTHALSVAATAGSIDAGGFIGGLTALSSVTMGAQSVTLTGIDHAGGAGVTGTVSITGSTVITLEGSTYHSGSDQTYSGPVVLGNSETITSDTGNIRFVGTTSTINGGFALSIIAANTVSLGGSVGTITALTSLAVDPATIALGGSTYHTTQNQTYSEGVSLGADATLISDHGSVAFLGSIDGGQSLGISAASGAVSLGGPVGASVELTSLTVSAGGISLGGTGGSIVHTTGGQSFGGPVVLLHDETVTSDTGNVTFTSTVDGAHALSVAASAGSIGVGGLIGSHTALSSLDLVAQRVSLSGIDHSGSAGVTGDVSVTATVEIDLAGAAYHAGGDETFFGPVVLLSNENLTSDGGSITFTDTVDGGFGLTATAAVLTTFEGAVGGTTVLASLTVTHAADLNGGIVDTTGTQSYGGPVALSADATLTSTSGNIAFASTVDGNHLLSATASAGTVSIGGVIGGATALSGLTLSASTVALSGIDHSGSAGVSGTVSVTATTVIDLAGAAYHSGGDQTFTGPVVLLHDETVTSDTGGLSFGGPINGAHGLSLFATSGMVSLGSVGTTQALTTLLVDPVGILLNGTVYHTTGDQSYLQAVTLGADATLTSNTGNVTFGSTVDGVHALSASASSGSVGVGGLIGGTSALTSLTLAASTVTLSGIGTTGNAGVTGAAAITANGTIVVDGSTYHSGGAQRFAGPVVLGADETFISDLSDVTFTSTINGAHALSISASSGGIGVGGDIGGGTALASLTLGAKTVTLSGIDHSGAAGVTGTVGITGSSLITLGGTAYHSGGDQSYVGPVALAGNETVTSDTGDISVGGPINGAFTLSLAAGSGTVSLGNVGTTTKLAALLVDPAGIVLDGTTYHTTGSQSYAASVTLGADATLTSDTGNVTFTSTVDGTHALSVAATTGTVGIGGVVGGVSTLTSLAISGANGVQVTSVHTSGSQSYTSGHTITISGVYDTGNGSFTANGAVSLAGASTIDPGSGTLVISGALTGNANLNVLGSGVDTLASINLNSGTLDLSGKTAGSFTVNGVADAAALITGSNNYSLALLGGGNIGDPTLANTGGDTLAGSFVFADGLTIPGTLNLAGNTTLDTETSGITLGAVQQGGSTFIVIADSVTLNGPWTGTGPRGLTPFSSSLSIGLGDGAPGSWTLTNQELQYIADPPQFVVIGAGTAIGQEIQDIGGSNTAFVPNSGPGPISVGTFTFDAPLYLIGSSIVLDGTLTKNTGGVGFITPGSISGAGSLNLGPGTGILAIAADSADLNGTVNGTGGNAAAGETELLGTPGNGPYTINGVCFGGVGCGNSRPTGPDITLLDVTILNANDLNSSQGGLAAPGDASGGTTNGSDTLGGVSPSGGPSGDNSAPTDAAVDALSGPLEAKPPTQAQPRLQGYYISLLGGMLYEWRDLSRASTSNTVPEENNEFSGWGNEARW